MKYDAAAIGELLIDFTCVSTDEDGYPTMAAHPGGAPANWLAALAKLGKKTAMLGKVGADSFGTLLRSTLTAAGIGTDGLLTDAGVFTTLAFVTLDGHGDREFSFARKPGADTCLHTEELSTDILDNTRILHFGTLSLTDEPSRSATRSAVKRAREHGAVISFDPNLRRPLWNDLADAKREMLWGLAEADVVKISDEEADFLFTLPPERAAEHIVRELGVKLVFVTCGAAGCWFCNEKAHGFVPALAGVIAKDTTGAGDIFGGSAAYGILESGKRPEELNGEELQKICAFASACAGLSTQRPGGISSVPSAEEIRDAIC